MGLCPTRATASIESTDSAVPVITAVVLGSHHSGKTALIRLISNILQWQDGAFLDAEEEDILAVRSTMSVSSGELKVLSHSVSFGHFNTETMAQTRFVKGALVDTVRMYAQGLLEAKERAELNMSTQQETICKTIWDIKDLHSLNIQIQKLFDLIMELNGNNQERKLEKYFDHQGYDFDIILLGKLMDLCKRTAESNYLPDPKDLLLLNWRSSGFAWKTASTDRFELHMCDLAGRLSKRHLWNSFLSISQSESVIPGISATKNNALNNSARKLNDDKAKYDLKENNFPTNIDLVIFVVDCACFTQNMLENPQKNRLEDSIELFREIVQDSKFSNSQMLVVLTKLDKLGSLSDLLFSSEYQGLLNKLSHGEFERRLSSNLEKKESSSLSLIYQLVLESIFQSIAQEYQRSIQIASICIFDEQDKKTRTLRPILKRITDSVLILH